MDVEEKERERGRARREEEPFSFAIQICFCPQVCCVKMERMSPCLCCPVLAVLHRSDSLPQY